MDAEPEQLSELQSDLKSTTENIAADAEHLAEIEKQKGRLGLGDPRLAALSAEAERLLERIAETARVESALLEAVDDRPDRAG